MNSQHKITGGVYLVIDPSISKPDLLKKVRAAAEGGVEIIQIWNHWPEAISVSEKLSITNSILKIADEYDLPVLINEDWRLLKETGLDGVHFDTVPADYQQIKTDINREIISGVTCGNDIETLYWAEQNKLDYISFCSMFPSSSAGECEIVKPETVKKAKEITRIPVFLSGGITMENMDLLKDLDFDGIAVISGILNSESPGKSASGYIQALKKNKNK